jgi:hypothetical protein
MMKVSLSAMALLFFFSSIAWAQVPSLGGAKPIAFDLISFSISDYQVGDEWGRELVTEEMMSQSPMIRRLALATARVSGGTGFVLGEFAGEIVVATNHHVCPAGFYWSCQSVDFPKLGFHLDRKYFLGTWPEIDLTLMSFQATPEQRQALLDVATPLSYARDIQNGAPLMTLGFGVAGNERQNLVINQDEDCRVFSQDDDFRMMDDPDDKNTLDYRVWSFANGCDASHGDSGSLFALAETGEIIGLLWTARVPKSAEAQNSETLDMWDQSADESVWRELTYGVPAQKIQEVLRQKLVSGSIQPSYQNIIESLIAD